MITLEELSSLLVVIGSLVNDQPLSYVSGELNELISLTPNHLFCGRAIRNLHRERLDFEEIQDPT